MKKILYAALGLATVAIVAISCKKDLDKSVEKPYIPVVGAVLDTLVGDISVNTTVTEDTYLYGLVYVKPGVTLTINPGVKIYGSINRNGGLFDSVNSFKNKGTLCIEKGAKLNAIGTCNQPIVFTSDNTISAGSRAAGDWGGVVLYGNGKIHKANGATSGRYEAFDIVPNDLRNFYGGTDSLDNSGIISYVRIEFAGGVVTAANKEVNGLTLCGVGQGTTINHVEILKSGDDAFEFFGGEVNAKYLLAYASKDDDYDFDEGYDGNLQFIIAYRDSSADNSGSEMIEADNDANASLNGPFTAPFIANATLIGPTVNKTLTSSPNSYFNGAIHDRRRVSLRLVNSYVIANAMNYGIIFTPTTGNAGAILLDPPALTVPGTVQYNNIFQINKPGFDGVAVVNTAEGSPASFTLANDPTIVSKLISANNLNNGLAGFSDFNLGGTLENTASTPFLTGGTDLTTVGLTFFTGTNQRGAVPSDNNWTLAAFTCGAVSPWISTSTN
jgi:hypothetical protein